RGKDRDRDSAVIGCSAVNAGKLDTGRSVRACQLTRSTLAAVGLRAANVSNAAWRSLRQRRSTGADGPQAAVRATPLLNHFVSAQQHGLRNREAERLGSLHVDDELELGRLFDRQIGRLRAFEDLVDIGCRVAEQR